MKKDKPRVTAVVLAAGEGIRMKSSLPKVLHPICGKPMLLVLLDTLEELRPRRILVVAGNGAEKVKEAVGDRAEVILQEKRLGTGHAVLTAGSRLQSGDEHLLVVAGDVPLVTAGTLRKLVSLHFRRGTPATLLTVRSQDPWGYGRVIRDAKGEVEKIVEEKDASPAEKAVEEINASVYLFERRELFACLPEVGNRNRKQEYYLTDVIALIRERGGRVAAISAADPTEGKGINTRAELAEAERVMRNRINRRLLDKGVTVIDPSLTYVDLGVKVGKDTVIHPLTFLQGETKVGRRCIIGPAARIIDSVLGDEVTVQESVVRGSVLEKGCSVGPFASLRPGTRLERGARAGTFVEMKNTAVGEGSKVPHLSYMGDAVIGRGVNVGAGSITCNYDGEKKHATFIDDGAFIGSDTMLIAPVRVGREAMTGAGSAISRDVPEGALAVERSEQHIMENWKKRKAADSARLRKPGLSRGKGAEPGKGSSGKKG